MSVKETFKDFRSRLGLSIRDAAKAMGMKSPSGWQHYESVGADKEEIPAEMAIKMLYEWVGQGNPMITKEEILAICPTLAQFIEHMGPGSAQTYNSMLRFDERPIKLSIDVEVEDIDHLKLICDTINGAFDKLPRQ